MMNTDTFWSLIDRSIKEKNTKDKNDQGDRLMDILKEYSDIDLIGFHITVKKMREELDSDAMREIAFMMGYRDNDTAYEGFRNWVISLGNEHYIRAKKSPSHLLTIDDPNLFVVGRPYCPDLNYVASGAFYDNNGLDADWDTELFKASTKDRIKGLEDLSSRDKDLDNDIER